MIEKKKDSHLNYYFIIAGSLAIHILIYYFSEFVFGKFRWNNIPFHTAIEIAGSFIAILVAITLFDQEKEKKGTSFNIQLANSLLAMGFLDALHSIYGPGDTFVWYHSISIFTGGLFFSFVWLSSKKIEKLSRLTKYYSLIPVLIVFMVTTFLHNTIPSMTRNNYFTFEAVFLNATGGLLFLLGVIKIFTTYLKDRRVEDILFSMHGMLFGLAALMFESSTLWDLSWWGWHLLRLFAYAVAIYLVFFSFKNKKQQDLYRKSQENMLLKEKNEIFDYMPISVFKINHASQIIYCNKQLLELVDEENVLRKNWLQVLNPENTIEVQERWTEAREKSRSFYSPLDLSSKDKILNLSLIIHPIFKNNEVQEFLGTLIDYSVHKELQHSQKIYHIYKNAIDHTAIIAFTDPNGIITYVNDNFCILSEYHEDELIGKDHRILNSGKMGKEYFKNMWNVIKAGQVWHGEICNRSKSGRIYWVDTTIIPFTDINGDIEKFVAIRYDITLLKMQQKKLDEAVSLAEKHSGLKSLFLANMSHEIRTPLTGILGITEILKNTLEKEENLNLIKAIEDCGENLLSIINDILDLSKIEAGKLEIENENFDLNELLKTSILLYSNLASKKGLKMSYTIENDSPSYLKGGGHRIKQILNNLLSNAIKFTDRGEVKVNVKVKTQNGIKNRLIISVEDTGIGINKNDIKILFQKFQQANNHPRGVSGTGLGLSLSKKLAKLMDGDITVESSPGIGSTFTMNVGCETGKKVTKDQTTHTLNSKIAKVLIVDDNDVNLFIINEFIEKLGHTATICRNGKEAISKLETETFDIVLLDCHMPVLDGFETMEIIQKRWGNNRPPVIAISASALSEDIDRCYAAGMDEFISKPISYDGLRTIIGKVLFTN